MDDASSVTKVINVGIPVTDQERALVFYTRELGMEKRRDSQLGDGRRWLEVAPPGAATTIALVPAGMPIGIRLGVTDAGAAHARLRDRGTDADAELTLLGSSVPPMVSIRAPDGNRLILIGGSS